MLAEESSAHRAFVRVYTVSRLRSGLRFTDYQEIRRCDSVISRSEYAGRVTLPSE